MKNGHIISKLMEFPFALAFFLQASGYNTVKNKISSQMNDTRKRSFGLELSV